VGKHIPRIIVAVMNFLAHSALAFDDPALVAGQFAGDFVRGADLGRFPARVASGIRLHRRIDAFTDAHPAVVEARRSFDPDLRRHAGIVIDVIFDHLLAREWPSPHGRDLRAHAAWVDASLVAHADCLPPALARFRGHIAREDVLAGNRDATSVATTFARLSRRSPRMAPLALAAGQVGPLAERLQEAFRTLWPELERTACERLDELLADEPPVGECERDERVADAADAGDRHRVVPVSAMPEVDDGRRRDER